MREYLVISNTCNNFVLKKDCNMATISLFPVVGSLYSELVHAVLHYTFGARGISDHVVYKITWHTRFIHATWSGCV